MLNTKGMWLHGESKACLGTALLDLHPLTHPANCLCAAAAALLDDQRSNRIKPNQGDGSSSSSLCSPCPLWPIHDRGPQSAPRSQRAGVAWKPIHPFQAPTFTLDIRVTGAERQVNSASGIARKGGRGDDRQSDHFVLHVYSDYPGKSDQIRPMKFPPKRTRLAPIRLSMETNPTSGGAPALLSGRTDGTFGAQLRA